MDEGVGAVWGVGRAEVWGPGTHLVFELWEAAYVVDSAPVSGYGAGSALICLPCLARMDLMGRVRSIAFLSVVSTWFPPAFASTTIWVALNLS